MEYQIFVLPSAEKELRQLPAQYLAKTRARIGGLSTEPRPSGVQKLQGSKDEYRIRQGPYRILYRIDDAHKRVIIYSIAHRKDAYQ